MTGHQSPDTDRLGAGWFTVVITVGIMAALIALGGMVLSFRAVSTEMVPAFGPRWSWLVPVVVDLTVFVFSGVDLVLNRLRMSHPLARWTVYGATAGTVWLNYSAGGTTAGRVAHVLMPSIWVVFVELMRHVVRRLTGLADGTLREPIPTARWVLSPWPTLKLWRRMVLWRQHSYPAALEQERARLGAVAALREQHGRWWRWRVSPLTRLELSLGGAPLSARPEARRATAPKDQGAPTAPPSDDQVAPQEPERGAPQEPQDSAPEPDAPADEGAPLADLAQARQRGSERTNAILDLMIQHGGPDALTGSKVAEHFGVHESNGKRALAKVRKMPDLAARIEQRRRELAANDAEAADPQREAASA